jgi:hypothetical protein
MTINAKLNVLRSCQCINASCHLAATCKNLIRCRRSRAWKHSQRSKTSFGSAISACVSSNQRTGLSAVLPGTAGRAPKCHAQVFGTARAARCTDAAQTFDHRAIGPNLAGPHLTLLCPVDTGPHDDAQECAEFLKLLFKYISGIPRTYCLHQPADQHDTRATQRSFVLLRWRPQPQLVVEP